MPPKNIAELLNARPFVPFAIHMDDGRVFEVTHPELVWLGKATVTVGVLDKETKEIQGRPAVDYSTTLALLHVVSLEPVSQGAA